MKVDHFTTCSSYMYCTSLHNWKLSAKCRLCWSNSEWGMPQRSMLPKSIRKSKQNPPWAHSTEKAHRVEPKSAFEGWMSTIISQMPIECFKILQKSDQDHCREQPIFFFSWKLQYCIPRGIRDGEVQPTQRNPVNPIPRPKKWLYIFLPSLRESSVAPYPIFKTGPSTTLFKTIHTYISLCFTHLNEGTQNFVVWRGGGGREGGRRAVEELQSVRTLFTTREYKIVYPV